MEKRLYLQPETKVLSLAVRGNLCEPPSLSTQSQEDMYGPPDIFDEDEEIPLF